MVFMAVTGFAVARLRNLFGVVMLTGLFSLMSAVLYVVLDAVDVAFTEAAVGAGIATFLMLATLGLTTREAKSPTAFKPLPLVVVIATGIVLVYGTLDMPHYGDRQAHIHTYPEPSYITKSNAEIQLPNIVTAILASYRGYDTLGETTVILTAGVGVILLLRNERRKPRDGVDPTAESTT